MTKLTQLWNRAKETLTRNLTGVSHAEVALVHALPAAGQVTPPRQRGGGGSLGGETGVRFWPKETRFSLFCS